MPMEKNVAYEHNYSIASCLLCLIALYPLLNEKKLRTAHINEQTFAYCFSRMHVNFSNIRELVNAAKHLSRCGLDFRGTLEAALGFLARERDH